MVLCLLLRVMVQSCPECGAIPGPERKSMLLRPLEALEESRLREVP